MPEAGEDRGHARPVGRAPGRRGVAVDGSAVISAFGSKNQPAPDPNRERRLSGINIPVPVKVVQGGPGSIPQSTGGSRPCRRNPPLAQTGTTTERRCLDYFVGMFLI